MTEKKIIELIVEIATALIAIIILLAVSMSQQNQVTDTCSGTMITGIAQLLPCIINLIIALIPLLIVGALIGAGLILWQIMKHMPQNKKPGGGQ